MEEHQQVRLDVAIVLFRVENLNREAFLNDTKEEKEGKYQKKYSTNSSRHV